MIPVSIAISAIHDRRNKFIGVCEIAHDLSEMQMVHRELEQREALLGQARKMAAIGYLSAGAEHDFNNTLQSVINALELVLDDVAEDTPARKFADVAIKAALRGASLTDRMLCLTREAAVQPRVIDLGAFLRDIQELLGRTLGPRIEIAISLDGSPSVFADPGQLQTALLNLAVNASLAMPRGGALTMAAGMASEDGEPCAVIAFTDTGAGTNEKTLSREKTGALPVARFDIGIGTAGIGTGGDGAGGNGPGGNGLGLSLAHDFAERSGGGLRIANLPGPGTTITLTLPSNLPGDQNARRRAAEKPRSHGRILLVDDVTDVLVGLTAMLVKAGFKVTPADSGDQALAILTADGPYDVLITDYAMPGMNGADLITRCRTVQPGLRAVVITGFGEPNFIDTLPKGTDVLHKPVQRRDLIEKVHALQKRDHNEWVSQSHGQTGRRRVATWKHRPSPTSGAEA
jgi:signal transduction histidine kinase/CheY-like chemotaxis protein